MTAAELRDYQHADVERMAAILDQGQGVLLFHDMRVGKLIEFLALAAALPVSHPHILIVAPLNTLWSVRDECKRWNGWELAINAGDDEDAPIHAINIEKLRDPKHWVFKKSWDLVLFDEAHRYRGYTTRQTKGAFRLATRTARRVVATGTPTVHGLPRDLYALLRIAEPKQYTSFWQFMEVRAAVTPGWGLGMDSASPWKKGALDDLKRALAPQVLRRTYAEVTPGHAGVEWVRRPLALAELDPEHDRMYRRLEEEWRVTIGDSEHEVWSKLQLTGSLLQLAASPGLLQMPTIDGVWPEDIYGGKVEAIADYVAGVVPCKVVVWCWNRRMVELCGHRSNEVLGARFPVFAVTGGTPAAERAAIVQAFQKYPEAVLVATIASMKEGISLDTATAGVFAQKSWNPDDNDQAAARILGPNQHGPALAVDFVLEDTVEADVEDALARKAAGNARFANFRELLKEVMDHENTRRS